MNTQEINLEHIFGAAADVQLKSIRECFDTINKLIVLKNGLKPGEKKFNVILSHGNVLIKYDNNPDKKNPGFHNNIELKFDAETNMFFFNFVVFDGCRQWNLYDDIQMQGSPEQNRTTKFLVPLEKCTYTYILYKKK